MVAFTISVGVSPTATFSLVAADWAAGSSASIGVSSIQLSITLMTTALLEALGLMGKPVKTLCLFDNCLLCPLRSQTLRDVQVASALVDP